MLFVEGQCRSVLCKRAHEHRVLYPAKSLDRNMSRQSRRSVRKSQSSRRPRVETPGCGRDQAPSADGSMVVNKRHLLNLALNTTSCAGCIASVRALLGQPLSELRMLKAIVEEDGVSALRLKELYLSDPKKTAQLLETFPMSSVLKKVQPVGNSQRCPLHRRAFAAIGAGSSIGWYRGSGSHVHGADNGSSFVYGGGPNGGGSLSVFGGGGGWGGRGQGYSEPWDWEEAWERMPHNLRVEVASVKASALETAMHHVTESARFCADCRHNVVQAHDILMGKMELEGFENEEEFDEDLFRPFGDRLVCEGESDEKVLLIDVADVEDLIYWHEGFSSQDFDSSSGGGQQRHAATLEQGQREVRSILGAVLLSQLRSVWHGHTAQVQGENFLFCLVVDAIRTQLAARRAAPPDEAAADLINMGGRCCEGHERSGSSERCSTPTPTSGAAEGRRQKRRQKRKEKKRATKSSASSATSNSTPSKSSSSRCSTPGSCDESGASAEETRSGSPGKREDGPRGGRAPGGKGGSSKGSTRSTSASCSGTGSGTQDNTAKKVDKVVMARGRGTRTQASGKGKARGGGRSDHTSSVLEDVRADLDKSENGDANGDGVASGADFGFGAKAPAHGGFGVGGLAFQLNCGGADDEMDDDVDHDLITEMEQLKARVRSRSDIDFLRKTLRQNYERFISRRAGAVLH